MTCCMGKLAFCEHTLFARAANENRPPRGDVLTEASAVKYVENRFVEWYGRADGYWQIVGTERMEPITGVRAALAIVVNCRHPDGDIMPFYVWLNEDHKLYGEF